MHPDPSFRPKLAPAAERAMLEALISEIGFGMIFFTTPDGPRVAHVALRSTWDGAVQFHLARSNALTKHLAGQNALAVVNGPDAYISPDWYEVDDQVPTWDYVSVEMEGPVRMMDADGLTALLDDLSAENEARLAPKKPWTRDKIDPVKFDKMHGAIVGFELEVKAWRPTLKLSQNKSPEIRERVAAQLEATGQKAMAHMIRQLVTK
jgi:transcriptional regulator